MNNVYLSVKHLLNYTTYPIPYKFKSSDTVRDVLEHISLEYNYNFHRHIVSLRTGASTMIIKDTSVALKTLPIYTESYLYINVTPSQHELYAKEGYTPVSTS